MPPVYLGASFFLQKSAYIIPGSTLRDRTTGYDKGNFLHEVKRELLSTMIISAYANHEPGTIGIMIPMKPIYGTGATGISVHII